VAVTFDWYAFAAECPVPIVAVRDDGSIAFVNRATAKLVGRGLSAIETGGLSLLVPPRLHPRSGGWLGRISELMHDDPTPLVPILHAGGAEIEVEWSVLPGHDSAGRSIVVVVLSQRRAHFDDEPAESPIAQLHAAIFDHAPVAIFHTDARGVITACNERFVELIGSSKRNLIGLNTRTLSNRAIVQAIERALGGERAAYDGEYVSVTGNRKSVVRVLMEPIIGESGVKGCVGMVEDMTEQRRAEEVAGRAERLAALGTLAAGVVHEVQNPLSFVAASIELALRQADDANALDAAALRQALANAREGAARVAAIVRELKMFAKSDEAKREPADVVSAVEAALLLVHGQLTERARLELDLVPTARVVASEPRLVQLFANLLVNAVEAIPDGAPQDNRVRVSTRPDGDRVRIEVEDTGRGIATQDTERIFEPFWTDRPSSMGLGLSTCHGIVTAAGGEIFVANDRPPGVRGAKLVVLLPAASSPPDAGRVSPSTAPRDDTESVRGRVLIVDDEERLATTLKLALTHAHDVDVATRGRRAIELISDDSNDYDVILCDLMLPDVSGIDVYLAATTRRADLAPRFVFLTGGAFQERTRDFLQSVPNARLEKPFDLDTLERLIAERVLAARALPPAAS